MKITLNGETRSFPTPLSIETLLANENMQNMTVAVARNGEFVPRIAYGQTALQDGDTIEIVAPMQGG